MRLFRLQVYLKSERAADALAAAEQSMDIMQVPERSCSCCYSVMSGTSLACNPAQLSVEGARQCCSLLLR